MVREMNFKETGSHQSEAKYNKAHVGAMDCNSNKTKSNARRKKSGQKFVLSPITTDGSSTQVSFAFKLAPSKCKSNQKRHVLHIKQNLGFPENGMPESHTLKHKKKCLAKIESERDLKKSTFCTVSESEHEIENFIDGLALNKPETVKHSSPRVVRNSSGAVGKRILPNISRSEVRECIQDIDKYNLPDNETNNATTSNKVVYSTKNTLSFAKENKISGNLAKVNNSHCIEVAFSDAQSTPCCVKANNCHLHVCSSMHEKSKIINQESNNNSTLSFSSLPQEMLLVKHEEVCQGVSLITDMKCDLVRGHKNLKNVPDDHYMKEGSAFTNTAEHIKIFIRYLKKLRKFHVSFIPLNFLTAVGVSFLKYKEFNKDKIIRSNYFKNEVMMLIANSICLRLEHRFAYSTEYLIRYFYWKCHMLFMRFQQYYKPEIHKFVWEIIENDSADRHKSQPIAVNTKIRSNKSVASTTGTNVLVKLMAMLLIYSDQKQFTSENIKKRINVTLLKKNIHYFVSCICSTKILLERLFIDEILMGDFCEFAFGSASYKKYKIIRRFQYWFYNHFCTEALRRNQNKEVDKAILFCGRENSSFQINNSNLLNNLESPVSENSITKSFVNNSDNWLSLKCKEEVKEGDLDDSSCEELDTIDGVDILSFKTLDEMEDFTRQQFRLSEELSRINAFDKMSSIRSVYDGAIVPTKTDDITKIKGWRNKYFAPEPGSSRSVSEESYCKSEAVSEQGKYLGKEASNRLLREQLDSTYARSVAEDIVLRDLERRMNCQKDPKLSIFDSSILNDFLNQHSALKISYEVPKLSAADTFPSERKINLDSLDTGTKHNSNQLQCSPKFNYKICSGYKPKTKAEKRKLLEIELLDECENKKVKKSFKPKTPNKAKIDFNPNYKYMWVQGRPIRIMANKSDSCKKTKFGSPDANMAEYKPVPDFRKPIALQNCNYLTDLPYEKAILPCGDDRKLDCSVSYSPSKEQGSRPQYKLLPEKMDDEVSPQNQLETEKKSAAIPVLSLCKCCSSDNQNIHSCKPYQYKLGLLLSIGANRPISNDAMMNISNLKCNDGTVDSRWANIAVSALQSSEKRVVRRIVVPVVSEKLINKARSVLNKNCNAIDTVKTFDLGEFLGKIDSYGIPNKPIKVTDDVKNIMNNVLDYVCCLYEIPPLKYDPDAPKIVEKFIGAKKFVKNKCCTSGIERELRRLINVSIIDVTPNTEEEGKVCTNDFCLKGCICSSLNGKFSQTHCGLEQCMFECRCPDKYAESLDYVRYKQKSRKLAKEEKQWHQTVIRKQNKVISVVVGTERVKREKKLPQRFRNNVVLGKELFSIDTRNHELDEETFKCEPGVKEPSSVLVDPLKNKKKSSPEPIKQEVVSVPSEYKPTEERKKMKKESLLSRLKPNVKTMKIESVKRTTLDKILSFCSGSKKDDDEKTLADVLIWCVVHKVYNCNCSGWVCDLRNNYLLWKPSKEVKYLSFRHMSTMILSKLQNPSRVQIYDTKIFCARTFGAITNYSLRNKSEIYRLKKLQEFEMGCFSNSNSFYKIKKNEKFIIDILSNSGNELDEVDNSDIKPEVIREDNEKRYLWLGKLGMPLKAKDLEHLLSLLPSFSVICKWWVVQLNELFDFVMFDENEDPLSYGMLKIALDKSQALKRTVYLPAPHKRNIFGSSFGVYAVNTLGNAVCFGPYGLEDDHMLMAYKWRRQIIIVPFLNIIAKNSSNVNNSIRGFWCYTKRKNCPNDHIQLPIKAKVETSDIPNFLVDMSKKLPDADCSDLKEKSSLQLSGQQRSAKSSEEQAPKSDLVSQHKVPQILPVSAPTEKTKENINHYITKGLDIGKGAEYGLLCLTCDIGYLPVTEYTSEKLTVQDPLDNSLFHTFKHLKDTSNWLNTYLSRRMVFEPKDLSLEWIIVKPGVLKKISTFDSKILSKSYVLSKNGVTLKNKGVSHTLIKPRFNAMPSTTDSDGNIKLQSKGVNKNHFIDPQTSKRRKTDACRSVLSDPAILPNVELNLDERNELGGNFQELSGKKPVKMTNRSRIRKQNITDSVLRVPEDSSLYMDELQKKMIAMESWKPVQTVNNKDSKILEPKQQSLIIKKPSRDGLTNRCTVAPKSLIRGQTSLVSQQKLLPGLAPVGRDVTEAHKSNTGSGQNGQSRSDNMVCVKTLFGDEIMVQIGNEQKSTFSGKRNHDKISAEMTPHLSVKKSNNAKSLLNKRKNSTHTDNAQESTNEAPGQAKQRKITPSEHNYNNKTFPNVSCIELRDKNNVCIANSELKLLTKREIVKLPAQIVNHVTKPLPKALKVAHNENKLEDFPTISKKPELSIIEVPKDKAKKIEKPNILDTPHNKVIVCTVPDLKLLTKNDVVTLKFKPTKEFLQKKMASIISSKTENSKTTNMFVHKNMPISSTNKKTNISCDKDIAVSIEKRSFPMKCPVMLNKTINVSSTVFGDQMIKKDSVVLKNTVSNNVQSTPSQLSYRCPNTTEKYNLDYRLKETIENISVIPATVVVAAKPSDQEVKNEVNKIQDNKSLVDESMDTEKLVGEHKLDKNVVMRTPIKTIVIQKPNYTTTKKQSGDIYFEGKKLCSIPLLLSNGNKPNQ